MIFYITQLDTPLGALSLKADDHALLEIWFGETERRDKSNILKQAKTELLEYFSNERRCFDVPLSIQGTDFQKKCWKYLDTIRYGETCSYKEQALKLGGANYARAVAGANNKNKFPIIIPCHRVIGSNGQLVGYAGGLGVKKKLLDLEKR